MRKTLAMLLTAAIGCSSSPQTPTGDEGEGGVGEAGKVRRALEWYGILAPKEFCPKCGKERETYYCVDPSKDPNHIQDPCPSPTNWKKCDVTWERAWQFSHGWHVWYEHAYHCTVCRTAIGGRCRRPKK